MTEAEVIAFEDALNAFTDAVKRKVEFIERAAPLLRRFRLWITDDGERPGCVACPSEMQAMVTRIDAALSLLEDGA